MKNFILGSVLTLLFNYCIGCTYMLYKVGGKKCSS